MSAQDRDAVIVSTARTPLGKGFRGALNITPRRDARRARRRGARSSAPASHPAKSKTSCSAARFPRARPAATSRATSRSAPAARSTVPGVDGQPLLLVGPAGDRDRGAAHHRRRARADRRRRRRVDLLGAERPEQHMLRESLDRASTSPRSTCRWCETAEMVASALRHPARGAGRVRRAQQQRAAAAQEAGHVQGRDRADQT